MVVVVVGVLWVCFAVGLSGCCWGVVGVCFVVCFRCTGEAPVASATSGVLGAVWSKLGDVSPLGLPMKFCLYFYLCAAKGVIGLPLFCGAVVWVGGGASWCWGGCGCGVFVLLWKCFVGLVCFVVWCVVLWCVWELKSLNVQEKLL